MWSGGCSSLSSHTGLNTLRLRLTASTPPKPNGLTHLEELAKILTADRVENFYWLTFSLNELLDAGVPMDFNRIIKRIEAAGGFNALVRAYPHLTARGYEIDLANLVRQLSPGLILDNVGIVIDAGIAVDIDWLVQQMDDGVWRVAMNAGEISQYGGTIDADEIVRQIVADEFEHPFLGRYAESLLKAGASPRLLLDHLDAQGVASNLTALIAAGATVDVDALVQDLSRGEVVRHYLTLRRAGASVPELQKRAGMPARDRQQSTVGNNAEPPLYESQWTEIPYKRPDVRKAPPRAQQNSPNVRQWLREHGRAVSDRGRIPSQMKAYYDREVKTEAANSEGKVRAPGSTQGVESPALIRQWLRDQGYTVPARGRIPSRLRTHYNRKVKRRAAEENEA